MFGVDERALPPAPRPRRWIVAGELLFLVLGLLAYAGVYGFATPRGLDYVLRRLIGDAPVQIRVDDVNVVPWSDPFRPHTWKLSIAGLHVRSTMADGPEVEASRIVVSVPDLVRAWARRELAFHEIRTTGLTIRAHHQRSSRGFTASRSALSLISAQILELSDARVLVDPDPPLGHVEVIGITGTLRDVRYLPGTQGLHGKGTLEANTFQSGSLQLRRVVVGEVHADGDRVVLKDAHFRLAGGRGTLEGSIDHLHHRPAIAFDIDLASARFEKLVGSASGKTSPLAGNVDADLRLHAGGDIPRGEARFAGRVTLTDARFTFADRAKPLTVNVVDALPFVKLDEDKRLLLPPLTGDVSFRRGRVDLEQGTFPVGRRTAEFEAQFEAREFSAFIALIPEREQRRHEPLGLVVHGSGGEVHLELRKKTEYQRHVHHDEHASEPAEEKHRGLRLGKRRATEYATPPSPNPAPPSPAPTETTPEERPKKGLRILRNAARPSREP